jgi:hypothetical protein
VRIPPNTAAESGPGAHAMEFDIQRLPRTPQDSVARAVEKSTFVVPR